jgi:hypothetical protein
MAGIGHNNPTTSLDGLTAEDRKVLRKAIEEMNDSLTRVGAERDLQKEIINTAFDNLGVDKRLIRRMSKAYFKANFKDEVEENNQFEDFYTAVIQKTTD